MEIILSKQILDSKLDITPLTDDQASNVCHSFPMKIWKKIFHFCGSWKINMLTLCKDFCQNMTNLKKLFENDFDFESITFQIPLLRYFQDRTQFEVDEGTWRQMIIDNKDKQPQFLVEEYLDDANFSLISSNVWLKCISNQTTKVYYSIKYGVKQSGSQTLRYCKERLFDRRKAIEFALTKLSKKSTSLDIDVRFKWKIFRIRLSGITIDKVIFPDNSVYYVGASMIAGYPPSPPAYSKAIEYLRRFQNPLFEELKSSGFIIPDDHFKYHLIHGLLNFPQLIGEDILVRLPDNLIENLKIPPLQSIGYNHKLQVPSYKWLADVNRSNYRVRNDTETVFEFLERIKSDQKVCGAIKLGWGTVTSQNLRHLLEFAKSHRELSLIDISFCKIDNLADFATILDILRVESIKAVMLFGNSIVGPQSKPQFETLIGSEDRKLLMKLIWITEGTTESGPWLEKIGKYRFENGFVTSVQNQHEHFYLKYRENDAAFYPDDDY